MQGKRQYSQAYRSLGCGRIYIVLEQKFKERDKMPFCEKRTLGHCAPEFSYIISGFGNVNRLILRWDQSFWDSESELDTFGIAEDTWNDR